MPDDTTQVINENAEKEWSQNWSLWHTRQNFISWRKCSTVIGVRHPVGQVTTEQAYVTSRQSTVIYCSKEHFMQN
jgi:hypothetical protein